MKQYIELVEKVISEGRHKSTRSGDVISIFGHQSVYDLRNGFPLLTTKRVNFKAVVKELLWFIRGETNTATLGCKIWDAWADENGDLGPIYGKQWRDFGGIDQLVNVIRDIKLNPDSRRHIVSAWNPPEIDDMALPPCHAFFQFYAVDGFLDCQLYQRSADIAVGVPFNIASYSLLLMMVANECRLKPRFFIHTLGDAHIYANHIKALKKQIEREPTFLPKIHIDKVPFFKIKKENIHLVGYHPHPAVKFGVSV